MDQENLLIFDLTLVTKAFIPPLSLLELLDPLIPETKLLNNNIKYEQKNFEKGENWPNLCTDLVVRYDIMNNIHSFAIKIEKAFIILTKIVTEKKNRHNKCKKTILLAKIGEEIIKNLLKKALLKSFKNFVSQIQLKKTQELICKVTTFCISLSKVVKGKEALYKKCSKILISAKISDEIFKRILMKSYMKKFKNAIADVVLIKHFYKTFLEIIGFESDNIFLDKVLKKVIKKTAKEKNQNLMLYEDIAAHIQSLAKNKQTKKINKNLLQETSKTYNNLLISNHKNNQKLQEIISKKTKLQQDYNDLVKKVQKTHHDKAELESESKLKTSSLDNSNKKNQDLEIKSSEISESILNLRSNLKKQKSNEHSLVLAEDKNKKQKLHNDFLTEKLVSTEKSFKDLEYKNQNLEFKIKALEVQREKNMKIITRENKKLEKNEENKNFCNKTENGVTFEPQKFINRIRSRSPRANFSTKPLGPINFPLSLSPRRPKFPVVTSRQGFVMNKKINFNNKPVACNNVYNQDQVVTSSWSLVLLLVLFIILLIIY